MTTLAQRLAIQRAEQDTHRASLAAKEKQKKDEEKAAKKKAAAPAPTEEDDNMSVITTTTSHISRSQTFGVTVSASRVLKVLQRELYGEQHTKIEELKERISEISKQLFPPKIKVKKDGTPVVWNPPSDDLRAQLIAKKDSLNAELKECNSDEYQVSKDVDVLISTLLDLVMKSFADFVFTNTLQAGRKTATLECTLGELKPTVGHVPLQHSEYWGLLASTSVIRDYDSYDEGVLMKEKRAANAAEKVKKQELKEALIAQGKDPKIKRTRAPVDPDADPQLKEYMKHICNSLKKSSYEEVNTSSRLTEQMAQIALEIIKNISRSIRHIIPMAKRRTATAPIVETAIMCALETAGVSEEVKQIVKENLENKTEIHTDQTKSRAVRAQYRLEERTRNLSVEEQQAILAKQIADEQAKQKARIEAKRKHAEKILTEAQTLQSDDTKIQELQKKMAEVQLQAQTVTPPPVAAQPVVQQTMTPEQIAAYQQQQAILAQQMAAQQHLVTNP